MRDRKESARRVLGALTASAGVLLLSGAARAQDAAPAPGTATPTSAPSARVAPAPVGASAAEASTSNANTAGPTKAEFDALLAEVKTLKDKQVEAEAQAAAEAEAAALASEQEVEVNEDTFKIYGFMDMGIQRFFANETALTTSVIDANALTFAMGNIDLYFDFNPVQDWRALAEVRFTNAPLGQIVNYGGLAGQFERRTTEQYDPNASVPNAPMWGGYTVIERAYIEWSHYQAANVIVGYFFTPFGIWNVDHGSPTLLTMGLPQFIQQKWLPLRQTGVQLLGSFFKGEWEIAYRAWLTNGRQEQNPFDYDDDKGFGGRVLMRRDRGAGANMQFGLSYQFGHVRDKVVNVTNIRPVQFESAATWEYDEHVMGADVSLDIGDTRIRSEGIIRRQVWGAGKQLPFGLNHPGGLEPNKWQYGGYLTVAQQLPWWGLEPYLYGELLQQPWALADGTAIVSVGLNWRFTPATMLKMQAAQAYFFDWLYTFDGNNDVNNVSSLSARLVMAF